MGENPEEVARELLEVVPAVMKEIRSEMRSRRSPDLTVPQFRTLAFVDKNKGSSLSAVANHMGLTLPSTSRLVDILIARKLLTRTDNPADRRRVELVVTGRGATILEASRRGTLSYLAEKLGKVKAGDRKVIVEAMEAIRSVFMNSSETSAAVSRIRQ
jgi:MarR family transcriptional regulator for hemolysin